MSQSTLLRPCPITGQLKLQPGCEHSEYVKEAVFEAGELVLLTQPFYEKGLGIILPQADGPYLVTRVLSAHTAILADPMSGEPIQGGRPL